MNEKRKTVVVIDDEETILFLARTQLKSAGYDVITFSSGKDALARIDEIGPDLVILDIMMPDMNGYAVCRQLRENPKTKTTPILMVTALKNQADSEDAMGSGANGFLIKPVSKEDLLKKIQKFLGSPFK